MPWFTSGGLGLKNLVLFTSLVSRCVRYTGRLGMQINVRMISNLTVSRPNIFQVSGFTVHKYLSLLR